MSEDWVVEEIRPPTLHELLVAWAKALSVDDTPDHHKNYLPLNLWDETPDD